MARVFSMIEISDFIAGKRRVGAAVCRPDDHTTLFELIDDCFERAARIIAANFAAIMTQTGKGHDPEHPVCIVARVARLFIRHRFCVQSLPYYLDTFLRGELGFACEIVKADDATLIGSAVAALLNS